MHTTNNTDDTTTTTTTENILRAFYEPFRTGDTSTYDEVLAEDWTDLPLAPGQEQGPAGMAAQIALFRHAMPDYTVEHQDVIVQGDKDGHAAGAANRGAGDAVAASGGRGTGRRGAAVSLRVRGVLEH